MLDDANLVPCTQTIFSSGEQGKKKIVKMILVINCSFLMSTKDLGYLSVEMCSVLLPCFLM